MGPAVSSQTGSWRTLCSCIGACNPSCITPFMAQFMPAMVTRSSFARSSHSDHLAVGAHMEIARPSIAEAIATCAEAGCERVVVAPYFLSQGRHIQQDIPALVAEARAEHPQLECVIADPIGQSSAQLLLCLTG